MKKFLLIFLFILLSSFCYSQEARYRLIFNGIDKKIYLDAQRFKSEIDQESSLSFKDIWIKIELPPNAINKMIDSRKKEKLSINGYKNYHYTLENRIYGPNFKLCVLEKIDFAKNGSVLNDIKYPKKWIDISNDETESTISASIDVYDAMIAK